MEIRTKESIRTIKTLDRAAAIVPKTRSGVSAIREYVEEIQNTDCESENEYAGSTIENVGRCATGNAAYGTGKIGSRGLKATQKNILKWRNHLKKTEIRAKLPKRIPALPSTETTAKTAQKSAKTIQNAARAVAKSAKAAAKGVVSTIKTTATAIRGIVAAIAAGGWVVIAVILLICVIWLVAGSAFGIFAPPPDNENGITIVQTVREANAEYEAQISEVKNKYDYDMCFITGKPCEWSLVIAVYAVRMNRTEDVVTFDEEKAEVLKEVYRNLNRIDVHTAQITVKETRLEAQEDGSVMPVELEVLKNYLYIDTIPLTSEEASILYAFDTRQVEQLDELLSDRNKEMWDDLLSQLIRTKALI